MTKDDSANRPRNQLVTDATRPYTFTFQQFGKPVSIVVQQTAAEETWPGGALWDIGVLLARVFVGLAAGSLESSHHGSHPKLPARFFLAFPNSTNATTTTTILELGCGVGLTGLVAATVLGAQLVLLTDLPEVIHGVTEPNMIQNTIPSTTTNNNVNNNQLPYRIRIAKAGKRGRIMCLPLCWGNETDENQVEQVLQSSSHPAPGTSPRRKIKRDKGNTRNNPATDTGIGKPDMIVIGDVAYQHKPGAPSHFDALLATVLRFLGPHTRVVFGTRMRMPASKDLLELFSQYMEELVSPPVSAEEIDPSFGKFKHHITIHVFRKRDIRDIPTA